MSESTVVAPLTDAPGREEVAILEVGEPLPIPVADDARKRLSPAARDEIKALMTHTDPAHFLFQTVYAWAGIIGAIVLAEYVQSIWVTILAVFFIATRQNILALLMHEQTHRIGFRGRFGDYLCNFTCACPLLMTLEGYRSIHLAHHQCYFTPLDPDYRRKQGKDWTFPKRMANLLVLFLQDLTFLSVFKTLKGKRGNEGFPMTRVGHLPIWVRLLYYACWAALFTWLHLWWVFLIYWFLPLATILQVIIRWGAICEHKYNLVHPTLGESTPIIELSWWEKLLFPNLNFTLHIYHHLYPVISYAKLPRVHEIFRKEGFVNDQNVFHGYGAYLKFLVKGPQPAEGATAAGSAQGPSAEGAAREG